MDLRLLGSVEAAVDGTPLPLGATKQRAVLAMLALEANRPVSADRIAEGLWGESPPPSGGKIVQQHISQLRKALDGHDVTITTRARGYQLVCAPEDVDLARAERLVAEAGNGAATNGAARDALALWRGPPLADVADEPFAAAEIRRCDELWLQAKELAIDADLAAGRHDDVLREVVELAREHPLQEHVQGQLMLALYRSGRQTEALEVFRRTRARLVDEIGSEPGPELRRLHEEMLQQSPSLDPPARVRAAPAREPAPADGRPPQRRRVVAMLVALGVLAVVAGLAGVLLLGGSDITLGEDSVARIGSDGVRASYPVGHGPTAVASGAGSVWVANGLDGTVTRVDRNDGHAVTIEVGTHPGALAFGARSLWVGGEGRDVAQVDPRSNRVVQRIDVGGHPTALAVGYGALWVAQPREGVVVRLDLDRRRPPQRLAAGAGPSALAAGAGAVWVTAEDSGQLVRLTPSTGLATASTNVGNGPAAVAVGEGAVWVANRPDGTISRVDPASGAVAGTLRIGAEAVAIAIASGSVWAADAAGRRLVQVDPASGRVTARLAVASSPVALAGGPSLWVAAGARPTSHRGGRMVVESSACGDDCLDPAGGYSQAWETLTVVYDGLLGYRRAPGAAGEALVGALAKAVPKPLDGGRTYVFTLRPGVRFSDGRRVRAADVRPSLERAIRLSRETLPGFFDSLPGAAACAAGDAPCDLSRAVVTDERAHTVTIRLRRPDPTLPYRLANPVAAVVPADSAVVPQRPPPLGTGPYRIVSVDDMNGSTTLRRNPHFHSWSAARPDGFADTIVVRRQPPGEEQRSIDAVERRASDLAPLDYGGGPVSAAQRSGVVTRFPGQVVPAPTLATDFMFLNVREPPFDDVRVRRAVNLATDRARMVALFGGPEAAQPACQVVPPSIPGAQPYCPYTARPSAAGTWTRPDFAGAKRLIAATGTRGMHVTVWADSSKVRISRYFAGLLQELGYRTSLKVVNVGFDYFNAAGDPRNHAQIGISGWAADYPTAANFFDLFSCASRDAPDSLNLSQFCSPALDREAAAAQAAEGPAAEEAWAAATRHLTQLAPAVAITTRQRTYFAAPRTGDVLQNPVFGVMLERAWVR